MTLPLDSGTAVLLERSVRWLLAASWPVAALWLAMRLPGMRRLCPAALRFALWWLVCLHLLIAATPIPAIPVTLTLPRTAHRLLAPARRIIAASVKPHRPVRPTAMAPYTRTPAVEMADGQAEASPTARASQWSNLDRGLSAKRELAATPRGLSGASILISRLSQTDSPERIATLAWLAGVLVVLLSTLLGGIRIRRIVGAAWEADPGHPASVALRAVRLPARCSRLPRLLLSRSSAGPMLTLDSRMRRVIVMPEDCAETLSHDQLCAVLAHELAHLRRKDLWLSLVPALCRCVLWFLPLAWIAARECLACAEEACDAAASRSTAPGGALIAYTEALVALAMAPPQGRSLAPAIGSAALSPAYHSLRRRLETLKIEHARSDGGWRSAVLAGAVAAGAAACLVPVYEVHARPRPSASADSARRAAAPLYTLTDLGAVLPGRSSAVSINDAGLIAGFTESDGHYRHAQGILWSGDSPLPLSLGQQQQYRYARAVSLNNLGDMALSVYNREGWQHAVLAGAVGGSAPLRLAGSPGFPYSEALAVSDSRAAVGYVYRTRRHGQLQARAALWPAGSVAPRDLGTLGGDYSAAYAVSGSGEIVGKADLIDGTTHAVAWQNGAPIDLGTLPGMSQSVACAVNRSGAIAGYSGAQNGFGDGATTHATFWPQAGAPPTDLGVLAPGGVSKARAINDSGVVVGVVTKPGGVNAHAALWMGGRAYDLSTRTPNAARSGWVLRYALGVNDAGQIVGVGQVGGKTHAFLLTPVAGGSMRR